MLIYTIAWFVFCVAVLFPLYDYYFGQPTEKQDQFKGETDGNH